MKKKVLASKRKQGWGNSAKKGAGNPNFSGGRYMDDKGYIRVLATDHPFNNRGYVYEHRLVIEKMIERYLQPWETVHHINEIKIDNRVDNLYVCTVPEHTSIHSEGRQHSMERRDKMRNYQRDKKGRSGFSTKKKISGSVPH